jgi:hypothetical protein
MRTHPKPNPWLRWCAGVLIGAGTSLPALPAAGDSPPVQPQAAAPEPVPAPRTLSLADLERVALRGNPTLVQAAANIEGARGRATQAGLYWGQRDVSGPP